MITKFFKQIRRSEKGTSIAEMLLVVAIIGILSSVTVASIQIANQRERVRAAARDLTSLLREAQTQSIEGQHSAIETGSAPAIYYVVIDQEEDMFNLYSSQNFTVEPVSDNLIQTASYHPQVIMKNQGIPTNETIIFKAPFGEVITVTDDNATAAELVQLVFEGVGGGTKWQVSIFPGFGKIDVGPFTE